MAREGKTGEIRMNRLAPDCGPFRVADSQPDGASEFAVVHRRGAAGVEHSGWHRECTSGGVWERLSSRLLLRFTLWAVASLALGLKLGGLEAAAALPGPRDPAPKTDDDSQARRKELLKLIDQLEVKLPRDLARKLIVISMKLATGYCSPYAAQELEEAIEALPESTRKIFEKEWQTVRQHAHWPRMPKDKDPAKGRSPT